MIYSLLRINKRFSHKLIYSKFYRWKLLLQNKITKLFTLGQRSTTKAGYVSNDVLEDLAGKEGVAHTTLRPAGIAKIDGNLVDVVTEGDFIDAGSPIVVLRVVGGRNIVRKRD